MKTRRRSPKGDAELDITAFMNLMIVLVPVLLLGMVFSQITVLEIKLPEAGAASDKKNLKNQQLELVIREQKMRVFYPAGMLLKEFPRISVSQIDDKEGGDRQGEKQNAKVLKQDFVALASYLKDLKRTLQQKDIDKRNITILSEPDVDYQTIVTAMDTVRSFKAVVAASVVEAELFPDISLGDAPLLASGVNQ